MQPEQIALLVEAERRAYAGGDTETARLLRVVLDGDEAADACRDAGYEAGYADGLAAAKLEFTE